MIREAKATKIKSDAEFGSSEYVAGVVYGMMRVLCLTDPMVGYASLMEKDGSRVFFADCSDDQYVAFANMVEKCYPGLCEFYYKYSLYR